MSELKCPNCGEVFQIDENSYANILQQVRNEEFEKELAQRTQVLLRQQASDVTAMKAEQMRLHQEELAKKDAVVADKDREIAELRAQLIGAETAKKLAVAEAVQSQERVIVEKNNEILSLNSQLSLQQSATEMRITGIEKQHEAEMKMKEEQIAYYRDFKARQSTKMIGESLEQHCMNAFNQIRMTAFPNAYFEKDNDARTGSKGDFIFRESQDGVEFLSIMFEMKNEGDTTATKHKNEDFFKELDKDRREKGCEYAVLVSLLESDSEYYNTGIVDVSYRYPKMYVIRPQFFITLITLLRNAAMNSLQYQKQLQVVQNQQIDLTNFEANMQAFKDDFGRNYRLASERFATAIEEIDKTIDHLTKTKQALLSSENNLRIANNKAENLSVKRLTKNAPSVRKMLDEQRKNDALVEVDD